jgi:HlyD family secretion protein
MAKAKRRKKILIFSVIGLALIGLGIPAALKKREPVVTVQTEKVTRRSLTEIVTANGKIQPVVQVKISPEVSGEIISLPVKEGQQVQKGELILKIKPDFYNASRNQAEASYKSSMASRSTAVANLQKAEAELKRNEELAARKLISDSVFLEIQTAREIAAAQMTSATHQIEMARALLTRAEEDLSKTTIVSPLTGTITKLVSQLGERVVGTATMAGTDVMTIADLNEMEARVDIGEIDVVLIQPGQNVKLEVDAFKDKKFNGTVTEIGNSSKGSSMMSSSQQEGTKFEVRIRVTEKEFFRPGMSVTAEIETRSRTNALTVPMASVTTRMPKDPSKDRPAGTNTSSNPKVARAKTNSPVAANPGTNTSTSSTNLSRADKKAKEKPTPVEVVFVVDGGQVKMVPVKIGISDDAYWEVTEGLQEGQEVVSGGYRAISRELEDGKKIRKGAPEKGGERDKDARRGES